ncbi:hypothetical protein [Terrarubrum flagellatum]|uniref:hypothetical protein n=1 Tax=Terrirubrum flagellatum TaxID=2895980 RepID=UPI003144F49A
MTIALYARSPGAALLVAISAIAFAGAAHAGSNVWRGPLYFYDQLHGHEAPTGSISPPAAKITLVPHQRKPLSPKAQARRSAL